MFCKREDGLGKVLLPFDMGAAVPAVIYTIRSGCGGWRALPVLIASFAVGFAALLLVYVLVLFAVSVTVNMKRPVTKDHPGFRRTVVYAIGIVCRAGRLRLRLKGEEKLPAGRFLLVSNHRSGYDPIATVWALRRHDMAFVTKPENLRIPIVGAMIYQAGYLPIDREDPRKAMTAIHAATALLEADVASVGVYPEGTRSHGEQMGPFHNGVFKIAKKAGVPIVIAAVKGTERIRRNMPWRATAVDIEICGVIPADETAALSTQAIGGRVRAEIDRALELPQPKSVM